ncbi:DUF1351 domain-containing protein [uncultured Marinobacter sp.]|uniref:DUF1351 domain-containing protein n=1 Tax=uncultured Marinobacter sp. TaxID=187379 RepID=UPI00258D4207|nr:DUF1351 domain-containing protein [uncultured Marinobacter sp.]
MSNLTPEIKQTPAVLSFNYEAFKANLEQRLEKYRTVVTADTVKQAKETATELNKLKTELDNQRKEAIRYVSAPIKTADDQMKECVKLVADGRQEILDQVAKFDQVRLDGLREDLIGRRDRLRAESKIDPEFFGTADDLSDLVKLGNLTATDRVTNKAAQAVADRVNAELQLQQTVERRLLELENASYRAGLSIPLQREHIEHFLFDPEEQYTERLQRMLDIEVTRQREAEAKIRQKAQREEDQRRAEEAREQARQDRIAGQGRENQEGEAEVPRDVGELMGADYVGVDYAQGVDRTETMAIDAAPEHELDRAYKPVTQSSGDSERFTLTVTMTATLPAGMTEAQIRAQFQEFIEGPGNTRVEFMMVEKDEETEAA